MAYSDITLTVCSDGLDPRATSLFPDGDRPSLSGGTAALEWITNGTLAHGDLITVRTNVAGLFGEPDTRSQSLAMIGDETWINGVNNPWLADYADSELLRGHASTAGIAIGQIDLPPDPDSPYYSVVASTKSSFTRHANISKSFKMAAFGGMGAAGTEPGLFAWPKPFSDEFRTPDAGKLFVASWMYYDLVNGAETNAIQYASITGTFSLGGNTKPTKSGSMVVGGITGLGERCTMVSGNGKTADGYVKVVADGWIYLEIDYDNPQEWGTPEWSNAVITGTVSGAVATMPVVVEGTNYVSEGSCKNARILQYPSNIEVNCATVIARNNGDFYLQNFYSGGSTVERSPPVVTVTRQWHRRTLWVDYRHDVTGKILVGQIIDNGAPIVLESDAYSIRDDIGPILANWGIEANAGTGYTSFSAELKAYTDNMMCIVSSSPTWAGVDYLEYEPLVMVGHRTSTEASFKLSRGVHSSISGKYLYVLSDPITPINTSGLLLTGV